MTDKSLSLGYIELISAHSLTLYRIAARKGQHNFEYSNMDCYSGKLSIEIDAAYYVGKSISGQKGSLEYVPRPWYPGMNIGEHSKNIDRINRARPEAALSKSEFGHKPWSKSQLAFTKNKKPFSSTSFKLIVYFSNCDGEMKVQLGGDSRALSPGPQRLYRKGVVTPWRPDGDGGWIPPKGF